MKKGKKLFSFVLLIVMSLGLTGCQTKEEIKQDIVGTWEGEIDFMDYVSSSIDNDTIQDLLSLGEAKFTVVAEFNEDNTCMIYLKQSDFEDWLSAFKAKALEALESTYDKALEDQAYDENVSLSDVLGYLGVDDTQEFMENSLGSSIIDFVNDKLSDIFDGIESQYKKLNKEGTYEVVMGKIVMTFGDSKQTADYDEESDTIILKGNKKANIVLKRQ